MGKAKRTLSVIMAALMLVFTCMTYVPASAAEVTANAPEVAFVGVDHSPLVVGDTETFSLTTANADKVQYNVVINDAAGKLVEDLTKGYSAETAGNVPFEVKAATVFAAGKYSLVVNAKRVSDGKLAATYTAALNCVSKDDANRVYANGAMVTDKDSYVIGDKITVTGINGLAGIPGPYKYRLHVYNATTGTWTKNVVANYGDKIEWTPSAPGTYVLDVHVNTEKSTTWAKYLANPTSTDVYGTYEAWKLKTVVVSDKLAVTDVKAPNQNTVVVTFNKEVGSLVASNFTVANKANEYSLKTISKVSVNKNVVTLTLLDTLADGTAYTVTSKNVTSADGKLTLDSAKNDVTFKFVTDAASIAFKATTLAMDDYDYVPYIIKDKDGNDITANFTTADLDKYSSDSTVIDDSDLAVTGTGHAIVNIGIADTSIETGNTIINVVDTQLKLTSIGRFTLTNGTDGTFDEPVTYVYKADTDQEATFEALDQNEDEIAATKTFKSLNPSVLVVDEKYGYITPVAAGTATIVLTATTYDSNGDVTAKVSKAVTVTVKANPTASSLKLSKTALTLVYGGASDVLSNVKVNVLDQYGNTIVADPTKLNVTVNKSLVVDGVAKGDVLTVASTDLTTTDNKTFTWGNLIATTDEDATVPATATATITYNSTVKAYVTISLVKKAAFAGYNVVTNSTKLDMNTDTDDDNYVGYTTGTVTVYEKDTNGNNIAYADNVSLGYATDDDMDYVSISGTSVTPLDLGTAKVNVFVGSTKIQTITYTIVNTAAAVDTVKQVSDVITVSSTADLKAKLFGTTSAGAAFVGYDQYGNKKAFLLTDISVISSNTDVVAVDGTTTGTANNLVVGVNGTTTLTVIINSKIYTIVVKVDSAL